MLGLGPATGTQHTLEIGGLFDRLRPAGMGFERRHRSGPVATASPRLAARSDRQALAALGAARIDDGAAAARLHANQKAVGAGAANFGGLVGAFHIGPIAGNRGNLGGGSRKHCFDPQPPIGPHHCPPSFAGLAGAPGCLSFGKPTITAKTAFTVNELHHAVVSQVEL